MKLSDTTTTDRVHRILLRLGEPRKSASKADAYWLCDALIKAEVLAVEREKEAQHWRSEAAHFGKLYADLVAEWNDLVFGLKERGVQVYQTQSAPGWCWQTSERSGVAPTMAAAHLAALAALDEGRS